MSRKPQLLHSQPHHHSHNRFDPSPALSDNMANPKMNDLLKWSIENSEASRNDPNAKTSERRQLNADALRELLSGMTGPSDAEMMLNKMSIIEHPDFPLE